MKTRLLYLISLISNSFFLFHLSIDANFDTIEKPVFFKNKAFRFSLIALSFGTTKYYFITFTFFAKPFKCENFLKYYHIDFDKVQKKMKPQEIQAKTNQYETTSLMFIDDNERSKQEEFLKLKISENNEILNNMLNRISYYTTLVVSFSGVLLYAFNKTNEITFTLLSFFIYFLIINYCFYIVDLFLLIKRIVTVSSFTRSSFRDLFLSSKKYALTKYLYLDYCASTNDVLYYVGLTKNVEDKILKAFIFGFLILLLIGLASIDQVQKNENFFYFHTLSPLLT